MDAPHPTTLSHILGQRAALATLQAAMSSGRVHHAWIFAGPVGVGKRTTAQAFAAALLDPTTAPNLAGELEPDPTSETQRLIAAGAHPDLHIITKELAAFSHDAQVRTRKLTSIPKAVIDEHLLNPIARAPTIAIEGTLARKIFIIDEAELLDRSPTNAPVQNAILKTLEEPPPHTIIILVTANEDRLLPTIRSRCQRIRLRPLDDASMAQWMARQHPAIPPDECAWVTSFAAGSPGRASLAIESNLSHWARALDPMLEDAAHGRFDPDLGSTMATLIDDWAATWVKTHDNASKEAANVQGTQLLLSIVADHFRASMRRATTNSAHDTIQPTLRAINQLLDAERQVRAHVNITIAMENLAVQLTSAS